MPMKKASIEPERIVLLLVLANAILIREAYTGQRELYWLLLISVPFLLFAIHRARLRTRKETGSLKLKEHEIRE